MHFTFVSLPLVLTSKISEYFRVTHQIVQDILSDSSGEITLFTTRSRSNDYNHDYIPYEEKTGNNYGISGHHRFHLHYDIPSNAYTTCTAHVKSSFPCASLDINSSTVHMMSDITTRIPLWYTLSNKSKSKWSSFVVTTDMLLAYHLGYKFVTPLGAGQNLSFNIRTSQITDFQVYNNVPYKGIWYYILTLYFSYHNYIY